MKKDYITELKDEVLKFERKKVDPKIIKKFLSKLSSTNKVTKELNIDEHFCAFFVPVNKKTKSVYLGHHIKADDWIPPGGHIKFGEHPVESVIREFEEELEFKVSQNQIEIFNLSIKDVSDNPRNPCKLHFDFWYLVEVPKINFNFLRKEFHDAHWHPLDEKTFKKIKTKKYNQIVRSLKEIL
ncbi:NUDIX hydrolase [Candidatus Roizmanbacteria bacterium]|nr:NUDIX hydrolase [Candidatus Roizmanbacteria bacterium]